MIDLFNLSAYIDTFLKVRQFRDYSPNGLQVEGRQEVRRLVTGVTACLDLVEAAIQVDADAVLVHHGYFWKGEDPSLVGMKARRIRRLLETNTSLLGYHLPLDAHTEIGNNAQLALMLGLKIDGALDDEQSQPLAMFGTVPTPIKPEAFKQLISDHLDREPLWIGGGPDMIRTVGWCTGAAQDYIQYAVTKKLDAFISGEISERTTHIAQEEGIHYYAAGHHATERYGVQALGNHLAEKFSLEHQFIEIDNPV